MFFQSTPSISVTDAAAKTQEVGALFIDVRTQSEYRSGHARGAKNIPLDTLDDAQIDVMRGNAHVYVICQSGGRSSAATSVLIKEGIPAVNVSGGTSAWRAQGLPME